MLAQSLSELCLWFLGSFFPPIIMTEVTSFQQKINYFFSLDEEKNCKHNKSTWKSDSTILYCFNCCYTHARSRLLMHYQIRNCPHFCCGHVIPLFLHKQKEVVTRDAFSRVCSSKSHPAALIHAASFTCKAENTHTELWYKDRNLKRRCQHNAVQPERGTDVSKNVLHLQETERQP